MSELVFKGRSQMKNDTTANWSRALTFVPKKGEIIVYNDYMQSTRDDVTVDIPGIKIGNGITPVGDLPFVTNAADIEIDNHTLIKENGIIKVNTTLEAEQDNTLPITSAGVHIIVGNINTLLELV